MDQVHLQLATLTTAGVLRGCVKVKLERNPHRHDVIVAKRPHEKSEDTLRTYFFMLSSAM